MDDSDDEFSDDFGDSTAPRRRTGMATLTPCLNSLELEMRAAMYKEPLLQVEIPFVEAEDEPEPDVAAQQPAQVDEELEAVRGAIRAYHMRRISLARSRSLPVSNTAEFQAAYKKEFGK